MARKISPARPLKQEFHAILGELAQTIERHLENATIDHEQAPHEARKAIKKMRALLRLTRPAAPRALKQCEAGFRDAARAIAGPRDVAAKVETLDRLISAHPDQIVDAHLGEIRAILIGRLRRLGEDTQALDETIAEARAACLTAHRQAIAIDLADADADTLYRGVRKTLYHWQKALRRARRKGEVEAFHELRKAVKAHAAQLVLLEAFWPGCWRKRRKAVDDLGEVLGELNDIHVMIDAVRDGSLGLPDDIETSAFLKILRKEAQRLARRSVAGAKKHLQSLPKGLKRHFRTAAAVPAMRNAA